eukprot:SAG31_NODE_9436_length_1277_cov_1.882852_2_plen_86_part_01
MLRPDCDFWMGSVTSIRALANTSYEATWTTVIRPELERVDPLWCANAAPAWCDPAPTTVVAEETCDFHCRINTSYELPRQTMQSAG